MNNENSIYVDFDHIKSIFDELLKGNIGILDLSRRKYLSDVSMILCNMNASQIQSNGYTDTLKYLLMICNLLYNRTDMLVLPVEDGVYDLLLELYKVLDPHFQVGSSVVEFKSKIEKSLDFKQSVNPLVYYQKSTEPKDEIRQHFENQLREFDRNRLDYRDISMEPIQFFNQEQYISKRTHNTKHNHPALVGTLDKCKFVLDADAIEMGVYDDPKVKILERDFFVKHLNAGIITENQKIGMVLELKYDGISVEADCNREVISARTRGDTGIGEAADITPILAGYKFRRNDVISEEPIGIKFEAIIKKSALSVFNQRREYNYANCRTGIIGLFGGSDAYKYRDLITLIPLAVDRDQVPEIRDRMEEINFINRLFQTNGEPLRYCYIEGDYKTCLYLIKKFAEEAEAARDWLDFAFDGIVVSYVDENIRRRLGRENYINKYSMAVKFNPMSKLTTFLGYTFEVGQTGAVCPMIHYAPVEFFGTIHPKSTGSSLKRFNSLSLKVGDIIKVTYTNDVMPYVTKMDCEQNRTNPNPLVEFPSVCPECGTPLVVSDSGKTAICPNQACPGRNVARMTNMLAKLNIKGFAESTIRALGVYTFRELVSIPIDVISSKIGPGNAANFVVAMDDLKNKAIEDYRLIGSIGFTGCAAQTWKLIFQTMTLSEFVDMVDNKDLNEVIGILSAIKGLGNVTANTIVSEYPYYREDMVFILENFMVQDTKGYSSKKQIRFTGCRNKTLEEQLVKLGYDISGTASVTKNTDILLIPYEGFVSTKTAKVSPNTVMVPINLFMENMDKYLQ